jgi:hypothetical protein
MKTLLELTKTKLKGLIREELLNEQGGAFAAADDAITDIFDAIGMLDTAIGYEQRLYKNAEVARTMKTIRRKHKDLEKVLNQMLKVLNKV